MLHNSWVTWWRNIRHFLAAMKAVSKEAKVLHHPNESYQFQSNKLKFIASSNNFLFFLFFFGKTRTLTHSTRAWTKVKSFQFFIINLRDENALFDYLPVRDISRLWFFYLKHYRRYFFHLTCAEIRQKKNINDVFTFLHHWFWFWKKLREK